MKVPKKLDILPWPQKISYVNKQLDKKFGRKVSPKIIAKMISKFGLENVLIGIEEAPVWITKYDTFSGILFNRIKSLCSSTVTHSNAKVASMHGEKSLTDEDELLRQLLTGEIDSDTFDDMLIECRKGEK